MATGEPDLHIDAMLSSWWNKRLLSRLEGNLEWTREYLKPEKSEWVQWAEDYFKKKGVNVYARTS